MFRRSDAMAEPAAPQAFTAALDRLVEQLKGDRSILAALLCGSLSHDTVWAKSDIDLLLVTIDDNKVKADGIALFADGVNVHACLVPRREFRRVVEGSVQNSFMHALLAKGRLLYTHDETIARLCDGLLQLGARDREIQLLRAATGALPALYKAHKWLVTRGDLDYTALWILYTATSIAEIEVIGAGMVADREVIPRALKLNPDLFDTIYTRMLNTKKTRASVEAALDAVDRYLAERAASLFAPIVAYLRDAGETRSCAELEDYFKRHLDVEHVTTACEYLADMGTIGKVSMPARLTKKSNVDVQELAFVYLADPGGPVPDDEWTPR
jgi:predicted nucleotidyltransferase